MRLRFLFAKTHNHNRFAKRMDVNGIHALAQLETTLLLHLACNAKLELHSGIMKNADGVAHQLDIANLILLRLLVLLTLPPQLISALLLDKKTLALKILIAIGNQSIRAHHLSSLKNSAIQPR
jgi:hypothetical protein